jgi:hypothetical protein
MPERTAVNPRIRPAVGQHAARFGAPIRRASIRLARASKPAMQRPGNAPVPGPGPDAARGHERAAGDTPNKP